MFSITVWVVVVPGVACVNTGRSFIGVELNDSYFAIAEERINNAIETL